MHPAHTLRLMRLATRELRSCITPTTDMIATARETIAYGRLLDARMQAHIEASARFLTASADIPASSSAQPCAAARPRARGGAPDAGAR